VRGPPGPRVNHVRLQREVVRGGDRHRTKGAHTHQRHTIDGLAWG
jgi:hypothetical protein